MTLTIQEAQQQIDQWIKTIGVRYYGVLTNLGILTEEVGELARLLVRIHGEQSFKSNDPLKNDLSKQKEELEDEMADVLWVLICLANQNNIDLTQALQRNINKKTDRDAQRHKEHLKP